MFIALSDTNLVPPFPAPCTPPPTHPQELTSQLPPLSGLRLIINSTLAPPLDALSQITQDMSKEALQASVAVANNNLAGLSGLLQGLVTLINQAQLQVRGGGAGGRPPRQGLQACRSSV
jgi:hypothetical protein